MLGVYVPQTMPEAYVLGVLTGVVLGWWSVWYMRRRPGRGDMGDPRDSTIDPPDRTK